MLLAPADADEFFRLHRTLMWFVNRELHVVPDVLGPEAFGRLSPDERLDVREAFLERLDLIDAFARENPADLTDDELAVVRSWRHLVAGRFFLFRQLKRHMIVLDAGDEGQEPVAYGVLAVTETFEELVGPDLPLMVETVLLPYRGRISYDGLLGGFNVLLGPGIRRSLNDAYREAKGRRGIVTSLPPEEPPLRKPPATEKRRSQPKKAAKRPPANPFRGRWRIMWMELWDQDFVDEEVEGYFEFGKGGLGEFQFGYVSGDIDYDLTDRGGTPAVEFSWEGRDETEPVSGRGWAVLDDDGIRGKILFHRGDQCGFRAGKRHKR